MKVSLINPPISSNTASKLSIITENLFYNSAPLGLCYIASVLLKENHEVRIIDAAVENLSADEIAERIGGFLPDAIGVTIFTVSADSSYKLIDDIKNRFPRIKIIAGGPHITSNPHELLEHRNIDAAIIGEGEVTFTELLKAFEEKDDLNKIDGLAYCLDNRLFFTRPREFISDLDTLPHPARHLLPVNLYRPQPNDQRRLPKFSMVSSRGCPYSCIFCDKNIFGNRYRSFSPEYIVGEMRQLVGEFGAKDIAFVDSTFTPNKERVYAIIKEMRKARLGVTWTCSVRADVLDRELLKEMKSAGCWRVRLGIESGNEDVLKFIKKGITKDTIKKVAKWAYELGLEPKGFFMIGHLPDTRETIEETIDFACSLPLKDITVQINTPLRNTWQYRISKDYGKIVSDDYSDYSFWEPIFIPRGLSRSDIQRYYRKFYLKFYLRPKVWYRHIVGIRSFSDIIKYLRGIKIIFFFLLPWMKKKS